MASRRAEFQINRRLYQGLQGDHEKALRRVAFLVERTAKIRCPVDTGTLRSSIHIVWTRDGQGRLAAEIGTQTEYATHVEFGTRRQPAQPFFRPAIQAAVTKYGGR